MNKYIVLHYAPADHIEWSAESPSQSLPPRGRCRRQRGSWSRLAGVGAGLPLSRCATAPPRGERLGGCQRNPASIWAGGQFGDLDVVQAESIEAAQALVAGHPHFGFGPGTEFEVHEAMPIGM